MLIRSELAFPGQQVVNDELYNQLFTMHGTIMLLLFATPLFFGFGNVDHAAADRLARRRVPAAQHVQLLAVPVRRPHRRAPASSPRRAPPTSAGSPTRRCPTPSARPGVGGDLWIMGLWMAGLGTILGARQLHHHDHLHARARHDHVPDADLRLEHAGHQPAGADRVPGPGRRAALARGRPAARRPRVRPVARRRRSCGSTCSGSSATPRSTSSRCRSSASSPRSCRSSAASRSSATSAWSAPRSASRSCRSPCGRTTCSSPARSTCRSSPA